MANWIRSFTLNGQPLLKSNNPTVTRAANQGWSGSCTLTSNPGEGPYVMRIQQRNLDTGETETFESAPMVRIDGERQALKGQTDSRGNVVYTLNLADAALVKLAAPGKSFPTFVGSSSGAIASTIAAWAGVAIQGLDDWVIPLEEVKQQKPLDALRRLLADAGQDFQITPEGIILCYAATARLGSVSSDFLAPGYKEGLGNRLGRVTGIRVERQNSLASDFTKFFETSDFYSFELPTPLGIASVMDISVVGYIDQIGYWNGDPRQNGKLISFTSFLEGAPNVPQDGTPPITHMSLNVYGSVVGQLTGEDVQAGIRVSGTPFAQTPLQSLPGFSIFLGTTEWPAEQPWIEPLIPTAGFASARTQQYLWQRNKGERPASGAWTRCMFDAAPGCILTPTIYGETWEAVRLDTVTHTVTGTSFTGHVVTY